MYADILDTPIGPLRVEATENAITAIRFVYEKEDLIANSTPLTDEALFQLKRYFKGNQQSFDLPLANTGSEFQNKVWEQLHLIPFGHTSTYSKIARALGDDKTVRAVGSANGKNPFAIVVPCHRVIGANGDLVGYAGGLHRKQWLLKFEKSFITQQLNLFS